MAKINKIKALLRGLWENGASTVTEVLEGEQCCNGGNVGDVGDVGNVETWNLPQKDGV